MNKPSVKMVAAPANRKIRMTTAPYLPVAGS
jgi:hypothetical protein